MTAPLAKRLVLAAFAVLAVLGPALGPAPAARAAEAEAMRLSTVDVRDIRRIQEYVNSIRTVAARFIQVEPDGRWAQGRFYLSRPGKMRIEYDPPVPILMVASGIWVVVYDSELKQTSYMPLDATPAEFLVRERLDILDEFKVLAITRGPNVIRVTLEPAGGVTSGRIRLTFEDNPLVLKQWTVIEGDGREVQVALLDARFDIDLNPDLFKFVDPESGRDTMRIER